MPVLLVRREVDDTSGFDLDGRLALSRSAAGASDDVEDLTFRVSMPVRTGAGLEEDTVDGYVWWGADGRGIPPDHAGEPVLRSWSGLHILRCNDPHGFLPLLGSISARLLRRLVSTLQPACQLP